MLVPIPLPSTGVLFATVNWMEGQSFSFLNWEAGPTILRMAAWRQVLRMAQTWRCHRACRLDAPVTMGRARSRGVYDGLLVKSFEL